MLVSRRFAVLALLAGVVVFAVPINGQKAKADQVAPKQKCTTKYITKKVHGKKKRVKTRLCHAVKLAPTATPTHTAVPTATASPTLTSTATATPMATATPTPQLPTVSLSLADVNSPLVSVQNGSTFVLTDPKIGVQLSIDSAHIGLDRHGQQQFYLHMSATKNPSSNDADVPYFDTFYLTTRFSLEASNHHPYYMSGILLSSCNITPVFRFVSIYNGESDSGWLCTSDLPQDAAGQFTFNINSSAGERIGDYIISPLINVTITRP